MSERIRSHKDLKVWQDAMRLVELTYKLARRLPADERFGMVSQMTRAAVSVPANIAEGHGSNYRRVFLNHLSVSRGSLMELETYLLLTVKLGYMQEDQLREIGAVMDSVGRMLNGLIRALKQPRSEHKS